MAALNFPTGPTLNQIYTANGITYKWDGTSWDSYNATDISYVTNILPITNGGTGASTAADALTALGAYPASNPAAYIATQVIAISSASYTGVATAGIAILLCNTTANSITVNLPTAVGNSAIYEIKKTAAPNSMILEPAGTETIDGSTTITVIVENESLTLVSDNTNWKVI